jgi:hypothetical protein
MDMDGEVFNVLREINDDQIRGYRFEQTVREVLPWSLRPPVAMSTKSEQFDAFFEFNSWHFLVECKAKRGKITPGSHDWEDFELKIRKRGGGCIGLFCTLNSLDSGIYDAADELNRCHHTTIIIAGSQWDDALAEGLSFGELLRFLVMQARSKRMTRAPSVIDIRNQLNDALSVEQRIRSILRRGSVTFLRRHRSPRHDQTYVSRTIDRDIADMIIPLEPIRLSQRNRTVQRGDLEFQKARAAPPQIAVVRDLSGAGKTTLSVQLGGQKDGALCLARAALEPSIDDIGEYLNSIGPNYGIAQLTQINQPIVYVIDSLDEGLSSPQKLTEFRSLMKLLAELNSIARKAKYLCYPLIIVLTIREEYWRDWESQLEGSGARLLIKRFSRFTQAELKDALASYMEAFHFSFDGEPRQDLLDALAHPFTMQVYAEANEYAGAVNVSQHMGFRVLSLFFERKKEDVLKRPISGYTGEAMMRICAKTAADMVERNSSEISEIELGSIIRKEEPILAPQWPEIVRSLKSEQIFSADEFENSVLRFRHSRFLEYLIAYQIQRRLREGETTAFISTMHERIAGTSFASPHIVIDNLKALTASSPEEVIRVQELFAQSRPHMVSLIQQVRVNLGHGIPLGSEEAKAIKLAISDRDPELCWHAFFALAAVGSLQDRATVLQSFCLAWDANLAREDIWKLVQKIGRHGLLLDEEILRRIAKAGAPKTWFAYLDEVSNTEPEEFARSWREFGGDAIERSLASDNDEEWEHVCVMLSYLKRGVPYPLGV